MNIPPFDRIAMLDWSAEGRPKRGRDSIWLGLHDGAGATEENLPTRMAAETRLRNLIEESAARNERLLLGADFAFGYPAGFAKALTGRAEALAVWEWLEARLVDDARNRSNRWDVANGLNSRFPGTGPFWFKPSNRTDLVNLPLRGRSRQGHGQQEQRAAERHCRSAHSVWKLGSPGAVGSQTLTGLPVLWRLRAAAFGRLAVWPLEECRDAAVVVVEIFPTLLGPALARAEAASSRGEVRDQLQVRLLAAALWAMQKADGSLSSLFEHPLDGRLAREEGWILGLGHEARLQAAAAPG